MTSNNQAEITGDMPYEKRLFYYHITSTGSGDLHFLTFRGLNRLNILRLQNELAQLKSATWGKEALAVEESERLTMLLHQYGNYLFELCDEIPHESAKILSH